MKRGAWHLRTSSRFAWHCGSFVCCWPSILFLVAGISTKTTTVKNMKNVRVQDPCTISCDRLCVFLAKAKYLKCLFVLCTSGGTKGFATEVNRLQSLSLLTSGAMWGLWVEASHSCSLDLRTVIFHCIYEALGARFVEASYGNQWHGVASARVKLDRATGGVRRVRRRSCWGSAPTLREKGALCLLHVSCGKSDHKRSPTSWFGLCLFALWRKYVEMTRTVKANTEHQTSSEVQESSASFSLWSRDPKLTCEGEGQRLWSQQNSTWGDEPDASWICKSAPLHTRSALRLRLLQIAPYINCCITQ